ncbi:YbaB/EbfC family DNA-binding protein [Trinickia fusca]|uniref:YbaB/EbfC family DNA-binding protein n=2 Tax=Trinickia fusca TaxID=2419777 RepID=A0A494XT69_9BURK|nr:YbaB/EbfC family DNA-binding protein [Trinickia fusca]
MARNHRFGPFGAIAALACAGVLSWSVPAASQTLDVPQPWIKYAQLVGRQFQGWLEQDNDSTKQLHRYIDERLQNADAYALPPTIAIRAWIGADGTVTKVEFDSLGDESADASLRKLLTGHALPERPPADMLQPLHVRVGVVPNPQAQGS